MEQTDYFSILLFILAIVAIILLIYSNYVSFDCIPGKSCSHKSESINDLDDIPTTIEKIRKMVVNNYMILAWRFALLGALISTILVVYLLKGRIPTLYEYLLVGVIVFFAIYLSFSWLGVHFFKPNGYAIEASLEKLRDRLNLEKTENSEILNQN